MPRSQSKLGVEAGPTRVLSRLVAAFFSGSSRRVSQTSGSHGAHTENGDSKAHLRNMHFTKLVRKFSCTLKSLQDGGPTAQHARVSKTVQKALACLVQWIERGAADSRILSLIQIKGTSLDCGSRSQPSGGVGSEGRAGSSQSMIPSRH